jgi:hypothetical protein
MADNFNVNTTQQQANEAEGLEQNNPAMTYVDFANQIVNNSQNQAAQAEAVKQAQLTTQQRKAGAAAGVNPVLKGYMSKDEALALMQAELSRQKLLSDDVKAQLQQWYDAAPDMVEQQDVKDFISRYQPKTPKNGAPFVATSADAGDQDKTDETGKPLVEGQMYAVNTDADGNVTYERGGQEKPSPEDKQSAKDASTLQKRKTDLIKLIAKQLEARRGNWLSQGLYRCSVALQKLAGTPNMTKQDLYQIAQDVTTIFTGGVPTEDEILKSSYGTKLNDILGTIGSLTGRVFGLPLADIRAKLISIVQPLYDEMINRFTNLIDVYGQGYLDVIESDPQWWDDTKQKAIHAAEHNQSTGAAVAGTGNLLPVGSGIPPATSPAAAPAAAPTTPAPTGGAPNIDALANALGLKKKAPVTQ